MKNLKWDNPELILFTNITAQGSCKDGTIAGLSAVHCESQGSGPPGIVDRYCWPGGAAYDAPECIAGTVVGTVAG